MICGSAFAYANSSFFLCLASATPSSVSSAIFSSAALSPFFVSLARVLNKR